MNDPIRRNIFTNFIISLVIIFAFACSRNPYKSINVHPDNFKITMPFIIGTHGIMINTHWGADKKHHVLFLDNFSPSWIKSSVVQSDRSLLNHSEYNFNTSTVTGESIKGNVGICDSLLFDHITFEKIPFYVIGNDPDDQTYDGVFGSELMSKGIWKIDFKNNLLTFTSSIDSLPESNTCEQIVSSVEDHQIILNVKFSTGSIKQMFVDLGFNGDLLLPKGDSLYLSGKEKKITEKIKFSTPLDSRLITRLSAIDTVSISNHWFVTLVSTTESSKKRLVGLQFFRRFNFIIVDFKNKKLLVPKMIF